MTKNMINPFSLLVTLIVLTISVSTVSAGDWSDWKHRMPVKIAQRDGTTAGLVPVDVTFSLFASDCTNPEKELRLILKTGGAEKEVPFQLSRLSRWTGDTDGDKSLPTVNGMITFFDEAAGHGDAEYCILYGNPNATAPSYKTDLRVSGDGPAWTIENSAMTVILHSSGQIASVTLKKKSALPIAPNTGIMHWNPGIFIPTRYWAHSFAWDPPEYCEIEQGPIFVEITRSGIFPRIPEVHLAISYRIFTGRSYVESGAVMNVRDDVGVVALRNDEFVFDDGFFTHVAWKSNNKVTVKSFADCTPINSHGDVLRLSDDAAFITMFNPETGIGAASVRAEYSNIGPDGGPATLFDNATYVSSGGHNLQYWFRPLIYFHVDWSRKQLVTVPEGSMYRERNLYFFYETDGSTLVKDVVNLTRAVRNKPDIQIGEYKLPPGR